MSRDNDQPEKCYAIVSHDGKHVFTWGYYGNEKAIPLYTKTEAYQQIKANYPTGYKIKKIRV